MPYSICKDWTCALDWLSGQPGNNMFTAVGAGATFLAAYLALRFSQSAARDIQHEKLVRARIAAAQIQVILERSLKRFEALDTLLSRAQKENDENYPTLWRVISDLEKPIESVDISTAAELVPLGEPHAVRVTRAFGLLRAAQHDAQQLELELRNARVRAELEKHAASVQKNVFAAVLLLQIVARICGEAAHVGAPLLELGRDDRSWWARTMTKLFPRPR